jgi:hypothetical protein
MTDRAAAFSTLVRRISEAAAERDFSRLLSIDALRDAGELMNSTEIASDQSAALLLRVFHRMRLIARPAEQNPDELAEGIRILTPMLESLPNAEQITTGQLGLLLLRGCEHYTDRRLLYVTEALLRAEVAAMPADDPDRPKYLNGQCRALQLLFECSGDCGFLSAAITAALEALSAAGSDPWILSSLGNALCSLAEHTGETGQLAGAVQMHRAALAAAGPDSGVRAMVLGNLGNTLCGLARRTEDTGLLAEAVQVARAAADANAGGPNHPAALSNLGIALRAQSERTGELAFLTEAADVARAAVAAVPVGHPGRVDFLAHLGDTLRLLSSRTGDIRRLTEAVQVGRAAVAAMPAGHHRRAAYLGFLGMDLAALSERTGDTNLLTEAIGTLRAAVQAAPAGSPVNVDCLSQLGLALQTQFERTGDLSQLTEAVRAGRQAVAATGPDHPERAAHLSHLGTGLQRLYERGADTSLLIEAINIKQEALAAVPENHPQRALYLSSLGLSAMAMYDRTGSLSVLEETIKTYRSALATVPEEHSDRCACLSNLSIALRKLFKHTGDGQHLADAIQAARDAVDATVAVDHRRGAYLTNLVVVLQDRFGQARGAGDQAEAARVIRDAVRISREAVRATRGAHPNRAVCLRNLGWSLVLEATRERAANVTELGEACRYYLQAAICAEATPLDRIEAYEKTIRLAGPWIMSDEEILSLAEAAIDMLSQIAPRGLTEPDRQRQFKAAGSLAALAAAAAVNAGRPDRAAELLEQTRGLLIANAIDARTSDLSELRESFPDLAAAFEDLRLRLEILSQPDAVSADHEGPEATLRASLARLPGRDYFQARRDTQAAWTELIGQIRALPGFTGFLAAPHLDRLTEQARSGPIVYVYAGANRCDAIVLTGDHDTPVKVVPLHDLTQSIAEQQADRLLSTLRVTADLDIGQADLLDILAWLWDAIAEPVLTALGYVQVPGPGQTWPRIWWCPVGALACFPLHAAGHHRNLAADDTDGQATPCTVMDRVISSYTTTVRGLAYARARRHSPAAGTALVIAVPDAPDVPGLPSVVAEADIVVEMVPDSRVLPHPTREAVLSALPHHRIAHFACHGFANWQNPAESRLVLYDHQTTQLTVSDISALRLTSSLAYLSACETTLPTPALPDEAVHMTGAFHLAGYQHVIGTLWPVSDTASRHISSDFYRHLTEHGTAPPDFSRTAPALHHAVRKLRDRHPGAPSLWAAHTHTGI